ncbi:fimbrial protein [Pantoea ananatis]|jgi:major type 1 subunit fimbrin (pilin)|uniref:Type-1 fimbrial protein, A chain n=1 Tax=Pantoea ananas TaxID=553 RepID=A0AAJ1D1B5_PANAN|nr:fimbrial protein [Pantoea ananatis]MCW0307098.1 Type-1 fimbrial protein, A chain [Pantoea ananatis]MCW0339097.1 Type-1 fimbrial protein, A chain [Pantoea ananatis]MCW0345408.1 Type-1 fimbrial protein, A chain [Pantoea ananatis]MCW0348317.1 Type-1 fimbrial protein, A chain [Pantoea ananatis]MCW0357291.1 Type-1 fimbrial protein, A chain [Pantoea ananatis]
MKNLYLYTFIGTVLMGMSGMVLAAGATPPTPVIVSGGAIHFTGKVTNAPCAVGVVGPVDLGEITTRTFTAANTPGPQKNFKITLSNCDISTYKTLAIGFQGSTVPADNKILQITNSGPDTANGLGIQILDSNGAPLALDGSGESAAKTLINGANNISLTARYISTLATVSPGQADADVNFTLKYQ